MEAALLSFNSLNITRHGSNTCSELSNSFDAACNRKVRMAYFYSRGDPANLKSREVRTREKRRGKRKGLYCTLKSNESYRREDSRN